MKQCTVCGSPNEDGAVACSVCGTSFPVTAPVPEAPFAEAPVDPKSERKAIAGFVLAVMGAVSVFPTPLQLAALLLCLFAKNARRYKVLRWIGVISSAVALVLSVSLWILFGIYADTILESISFEMYY